MENAQGKVNGSGQRNAAGRENAAGNGNGHEKLLDRLDRRIAQLKQWSSRFVYARIVLFLLFLGGFGLPFPPLVTIGVLIAIAVVFFYIASLHRRTDTGIARHHAWKAIKTAQEARRRLTWDHLPETHIPQAPDDHPFANDIGLFGPSSLHRLIDLSVSRRGSRLLADWLSDPAPQIDDIHTRQRLVRGLVPHMHFREHMQLEYAMVSAERLDGDAFLAWLREASLPRSIRWVLPLSLVLAAINAALFLLWGLNMMGPWFLAGIFVYGVVYFGNARVRETFIETAVRLDIELSRLKTVFRFIEKYPDRGSQALRELTAAFRDEQQCPSRHIRRILRDVVAAGVSMNPVLMVLLNLPLPWDFIFAVRLERKRRSLEKLLPVWLDALQRLEALQSLANLAALYPDYVFPEIREDAAEGTAVFEAEGMGHPLLPPGQRVSNDFRVDKTGTLFLITGSNMSGKSTFLRTVGINLALSFAGGPVAAQHFSTQLFRLYTCIQISDSLREGVSYFYAEVRRLKRLLERLDGAEEVPLFFLIDEIFKGTNNIERHVGGESYLRALAGKRGTGIVSTHDIELTALEGAVPGLVNLHFREHIENDRMHFDYLLRTGPCPTTNALVIMRLEGLPVPPTADLDSSE